MRIASGTAPRARSGRDSFVARPPAEDNDYAYAQKTLPGVNTLHFGRETPSRLMLPMISMDAVRGFEAPAGQCPYASMRCLSGGG